MEKVLRETSNFVATKAVRGVRITAKERNVTPRARVVRLATWDLLKSVSNDEFDGSCVMDLGIGCFKRR